MSHAAIDWAFTVRGLSSKAGHVLLVLAKHADRQTMLCSPGVELIAEMTSLTTRSVRNAMRELEDRALVTRFENSGTSNTYELHLSAAGDGEGRKQVQGGMNQIPPQPIQQNQDTPEPVSPKPRLSLSLEKDSSLKQTLPPPAAQQMLRLLAVQDAQKPPGAGALLWTSGLQILCELTDKANDEARELLGTLLKRVKRDPARLLLILQECRDDGREHPISWLMKATSGREVSKVAAEQRPARSDPPDRWMHLGDDREKDDGGAYHPLINGYYLDVVAEEVCAAARIPDPDWRGDWSTLIGWLREGLDPAKVILPSIRKAAARLNYEPPGRLTYFNEIVRRKAAA